MKICNYYHNEICYDADRCPLCEIMEELEARLDAKEDKIYHLEEDLKTANEELEKLRKEHNSEEEL